MSQRPAARAGRPPAAGTPRTQILAARLTPEERREILAGLQELGIPYPGTWLRTVALAAVRKQVKASRDARKRKKVHR